MLQRKGYFPRLSTPPTVLSSHMYFFLTKFPCDFLHSELNLIFLPHLFFILVPSLTVCLNFLALLSFFIHSHSPKLMSVSKICFLTATVETRQNCTVQETGWINHSFSYFLLPVSTSFHLPPWVIFLFITEFFLTILSACRDNFQISLSISYKIANSLY